MEVDRPPGPRVVVPSNAPPKGIQGGVRVCAEPGCGTLIEYYAVSSRCDGCTLRRKAPDFYGIRSGASNDVGIPPGNGNPYLIPVRECVFVGKERCKFDPHRYEDRP